MLRRIILAGIFILWCWPGSAVELNDPPRHAVAVVKSDTVDLPTATTALYIGTTGDIQVTMMGGEIVLMKTVPIGWYWIRVTRIWSTNTTASTMLAFWN